MLTKETLFVETTGVFGAGYVPRLLEELKHRLEKAVRRRTADGATTLNVLFCIDNALVKKKDLARRDSIDRLIKRAGQLNADERDELIRGLHWADRVVLDFIQRVYRPVDVVLRRGGVMHAFPLVHDEAWRRINPDRKPQPKVLIFLTATPEVIEANYADVEIRRQMGRNLLPIVKHRAARSNCSKNGGRILLTFQGLAWSNGRPSSRRLLSIHCSVSYDVPLLFTGQM